MKPMTDEAYAEWSKARQRGAAWFVLLHGVLLWGGCTGLIWSFVMGYIQSFRSNEPVMVTIWACFKMAMLGFPIGGLIYGAIMWWIGEWQFARERQVRCGECGYNLRGNESGVCPECGAATPSTSQPSEDLMSGK